MGGNRGSVLFLPIEDLSALYCRVSYHREKIVNLQEVSSKSHLQEWMLSVCEEKYLKMVHFQGGRANCLTTLFLGELYLNLRGFEEHMVLVQPKGLFELCQFSEDG